MSTIIIGGSGFIGRNLIIALKKRGVKPVVADLNPPSDPDLDYIKIDPGVSMEDLLCLKETDVVYHLAWTTTPGPANQNPIYDVSSNITMSLQILEACVKGNVKKLIFASSGGTVYGIPNSIPIKESHPTNPINSYGLTKLTVEKYLHLFHHLYGLDYIIIRPSNPFGKYQNPNNSQGVVAKLIKNCIKNNTTEIWGDGSIVRDFFYVDDLAEALISVADYSTTSSARIFNVGSGKGTSLNELIKIVETVLDVIPIVKYMPGREIDVPSNVLDIRLIEDNIGWYPKRNLEKSIKQTSDWMQESL